MDLPDGVRDRTPYYRIRSTEGPRRGGLVHGRERFAACRRASSVHRQRRGARAAVLRCSLGGAAARAGRQIRGVARRRRAITRPEDALRSGGQAPPAVRSTGGAYAGADPEIGAEPVGFLVARGCLVRRTVEWHD